MAISSEENFAYDHTTAKQQLWIDFKDIFTDPSFGDVCINVRGQTLRAHKYILMSRSKGFANMFEDDMFESSTNAISICDTDYDTIQAMLKYIYFGMTGCGDHSVNHTELFKASARFELEILQRDSERLLIESIDMDNAPQFLLLCDQYYAPKLKYHTLSFLKDSAIHQLN